MVDWRCFCKCATFPSAVITHCGSRSENMISDSHCAVSQTLHQPALHSLLVSHPFKGTGVSVCVSLRVTPTSTDPLIHNETKTPSVESQMVWMFLWHTGRSWQFCLKMWNLVKPHAGRPQTAENHDSCWLDDNAAFSSSWFWHICQILAVAVRLGWHYPFTAVLRSIDWVCLAVLLIDSLVFF